MTNKFKIPISRIQKFRKLRFRNWYLFVFWSLLFGIFLSACNKEDLTPPAPPLLIPHGADDDSIEVGIDAVPAGDWIYLEWRENLEGDLAGYVVYRDSLPDPGFQMITQMIADTFFLDQGVILEIPFYYTVTAVDTAGNESLGGDTLEYTLTSKPTLLFPFDGDTLSSGTVIFRWKLDNVSDGFFIVKIFSPVDGRLLQMGDSKEFFGAQSEFADTVTLNQGSFRWRVDYGISGRTIGSESRLRNLTIQ
jgi:hypothetical protein